MAAYLVIFGAAVKADGQPSGTLRRRVEGALAIGRDLPDPVYLPTGGQGRHGPAEAAIMRDLLLAGGAPADRIVVEDRARDTLESVERCHALLAARGDAQAVIPCTSRYHIPRCALLFRILGYPVRTFPMPADRPHVGWRKWLTYVAKECLALPYDAVLLLSRRHRSS
ncbi:MAG: YdcF family protein [Phenylobacterium sp.]|uniref:YdcF family protein n=1 Tax=Phenylobacterium sp. TaxID=1871053 RepID=UPI001A61D717|nr:YdcF family protein [Phenylobacterium sp.]MBL8773483.1 YdcF family protein [Phenylobacterium sp.]